MLMHRYVVFNVYCDEDVIRLTELLSRTLESPVSSLYSCRAGWLEFDAPVDFDTGPIKDMGFKVGRF